MNDDDDLVSLTARYGFTMLDDRYKTAVRSRDTYEFEWLGYQFTCSKTRLKDGGWLFTVSGLGLEHTQQFSCAANNPHPQDEWMGCKVSAETILRKSLPRFEFEMRKAAAS